MKITVVIPLYNKASFIRRALASVAAQTRTADEIVVVDDGSTDDSAAVVAGMCDSRIRLISQSNAGVSAARNRGVAEASHPLIAFLDADDEWLPGFLESVLAAVRLDPAAGVVFTNLRLSTSEAAWVPRHAGGRLDDYFEFFVANQGHGMSASSTVVRKEALRRVGGFSTCHAYGEDLDTWARLAWEVPFVFVPEVLAIYHVTGCPRAMDGHGRQIAASLSRCAQECRDRLRQGRVPANLRRSTRAYAQMLSVMGARQWKDVGDGLGAFRTLLSAFPPVPTPRGMQIYAAAWLRTACPARLLALGRQLRRT